MMVRTRGRSAVLGFVVGLLVVAAITIGTRHLIDSVGTERLREIVEEAGPWAPLPYVGLKVLAYVLAPLRLPGLEMLAGLVFGVWLGTMLSVVSELIGGSINFWIARLLGQRVAARFTAGWGGDGGGLLAQLRGWRGLLFARLFLPGFDFLSYAAGLTPIGFGAYAVVSVLGGLPRTYLNVALGATLLQDSRLFVAYGVLLAIFYGLAIYLQRWWGRGMRRMR